MKKIFYGWMALTLSATAFASESPVIPGQILYKLKPHLTNTQLTNFKKVLQKLGIQTSSSKTLDLSEHFVELLKFESSQSKQSLTNDDVIKLLLDSGAVEFAESDRIEHEIGFDYSDPDYNDQWHHPKVESTRAWEMTMGRSDVIVAVCDSGVEANHEDLSGNVLTPGYNFVTKTKESSPATYHGTMVAGLIASKHNNKGGLGVAPNVKILPLKITTNGSTSLSTITNCIRYGADNGAKVINVSFTGINNRSVSDAGKYARSKGALLVYSAGNQGNNQSGYVDYKNIIAVGATTTSDSRASFSNYGYFIDVVAPGSSVYTTAPYLTFNTTRYRSVSGTSFSAPITAGVIALIYSINPNFTPDQVEEFLSEGADDLGNAYVFGHGRVNSYNSVLLAQEALGSNRAPSAVLSAPVIFDVAPASLQFDSGQSFDPEGSIARTNWYINGEFISSDDVLSYDFDQAGSYSIELEVIDAEGEKASASQIINIISTDQAKIKVSDIALSISYNRTLATAKAVVAVTDVLGNPVTGTKVTATWDGTEFSAITDEEGLAHFTSPTMSRTHRFYFEVVGADKEKFDYLAEENRETTGNIRARQIWYRRIFGL